MFIYWLKAVTTGFTERKKFTVCGGKSRTFSCPKDYLIHIRRATGTQTVDGSCDEQ